MSRGWLLRIVTTPPAAWSADDLGHLTGAELRSVATLMGVGMTGSKPERIARLLALRDLRVALSRFAGDDEADQNGLHAAVDTLAVAYKGYELREMCQVAQVYIGRSKRARAVALIQWRNSCRRSGQQALQEAKAAARAEARPVQTRLF